MIRPVVSSAWLVDVIDRDDVVVVDTRWYLEDPQRGQREYDKGHLPGALFMDLERDLSASRGAGRHPLPSREAFGTTLSSFGIRNGDHVVAYDHGPGAIAARLWWMMRHVGHPKVSVLDGGIRGWTDAGFRVSRDRRPITPSTFEVLPSMTRTIDRSELRSRLGDVQLLDARAPERYRGDHEPVDAVAGHIPTALSVPTTGNLEPDGSFKRPEELAMRFRELHLDPNEPIVSSCGSGVTACHNILALHLAGYPEAMLYPGSWSDWSTAGFPVATGS